MSRSWPKLGVNIDHIATLRQLRKTPYPDLLEVADLVQKAGADQITVHLREDRRHIQDQDVKDLRAHLKISLNLEMAVTDAMIRFASRLEPHWVCLVPEKRREVTTEGGLSLTRGTAKIARAVTHLKKQGIRVSLFIEPTSQAVQLSSELGADAVELHTGRFCLATQSVPPSKFIKRVESEFVRIQKSAQLASKLGLQCHAGHGLDYSNVRKLLGLPIAEYNIGHAIVCRASVVGMERAVREMVSAIASP